MAYYTKGGEPPGQWAGRAAARLGLAGQVDPQVLEALFMENIGPGGEVLAPRHQVAVAPLPGARTVVAGAGIGGVLLQPAHRVPGTVHHRLLDRVGHRVEGLRTVGRRSVRACIAATR